MGKKNDGVNTTPNRPEATVNMPETSEVLDAVLNGSQNTDTDVSIPPEEEVAVGVDAAGEDAGRTEERQIEGDTGDAENTEGSIPDMGSVNHTYGCMVRPSKGLLREQDLALAWKESSNPRSALRRVELEAQAVDPMTSQLSGNIVKFSLILNDLTHGSAPGRTIGFSGWLSENVDIPNSEHGGLRPRDNIGWGSGHVWISVAYDLYDQVGIIERYENSAGKHKLETNLGVSTALSLTPVPPIVER